MLIFFVSVQGSPLQADKHDITLTERTMREAAVIQVGNIIIKFPLFQLRLSGSCM